MSNMGIRQELEPLSPDELIWALATRLYEPPFTDTRDSLSEISEPLRTLILIIDFDTEVTMQGILGFLENSTGRYLTETIDAFQAIGATETSAILERVKATLAKHGITHERLRTDFARTAEHEVTSFQDLHGDLGSMPDEITSETQGLYLHGANDSEPMWARLDDFVAKHRMAIIEEADRISRIR